jgi:hypothetical protein
MLSLLNTESGAASGCIVRYQRICALPLDQKELWEIFPGIIKR